MADCQTLNPTSAPTSVEPPRKKAKRCVQACNNCKRKKDRCDGQNPCGLCSRRNHSCEYSSIAAKDLASEVKSNGTTKSSAPEAPVPRTARFLSDGSGRYNYIGDSASLSFLQSARLVVISTYGECSFSNESFLLTPTVDRSTQSTQPNTDPPPLHPDRAEHLANEYLLATGCLLDLFDVDTLTSDVRSWVSDPESPTDVHQSCILLVLSIGLQLDSKDPAEDSISDIFFTKGRRLAYDIMSEEPSVLIVQAFALISMYLMGESRSDAAFMNLGIAIRGADTLGLHRTDRGPFSHKEALARERAWRSIRVLDIFLSASTGRPPATLDLDRGSSTGINTPESKNGPDELFIKATRGLCAIGERILVDVYKERSVSTVLVEKISRQFRDWVSVLPQMPAALETRTKSADHLEMSRILASAHLMGAYYWAITLLTRPFLLFHVSMRQSEGSRVYQSSDKTKNMIPSIAETCVVAAISGLELVEDVIACERLPRRLPVVLNSVLNCALAIGVAVFADYYDHFPLISCLHRATSALRKLADTDPTALHYLQIIQSLAQAAEAYKVRRDEVEMQKKRKQFDTLFGTVDPHFASSSRTNPSSESSNSTTEADIPHESHDFWYDDEYATIFPSGLLLGGSDMHDGSMIDNYGLTASFTNTTSDRLDSDFFSGIVD